jgi:hypothetical protein
MERDELLRRVRDGKAELDQALAAVPAERMETPGEDGVWSPKDQLSHLAAWHEVVLCRMRGQVEEDEIPFPEGYVDMEIDDVNRFLFDRDRDRTVDEARDAFERTHREVLATIEQLPEEALGRTFRPDVPDRKLLDTVMGNTFEHYEEHLPMLRAVGS